MPDNTPNELALLFGSGTPRRPIQELEPEAPTPRYPGHEANQGQITVPVAAAA
jgi:hypothetical protein